MKSENFICTKFLENISENKLVSIYLFPFRTERITFLLTKIKLVHFIDFTKDELHITNATTINLYAKFPPNFM